MLGVLESDAKKKGGKGSVFRKWSAGKDPFESEEHIKVIKALPSQNLIKIREALATSLRCLANFDQALDDAIYQADLRGYEDIAYGPYWKDLANNVGLQLKLNDQGRISVDELRSQKKFVKNKNRAYGFQLAELELDAAKAQPQIQFAVDFWKWLSGRGVPEDIKKTKWGAKRLLFPDVIAYLDSFVDLRYQFLEKLKMLDFIGPTNLDEAYLYFKYIVRGNEEDKHSLGFFDDWDKIIMETPKSLTYPWTNQQTDLFLETRGEKASGVANAFAPAVSLMHKMKTGEDVVIPNEAKRTNIKIEQNHEEPVFAFKPSPTPVQVREEVLNAAATIHPETVGSPPTPEVEVQVEQAIQDETIKENIPEVPDPVPEAQQPPTSIELPPAVPSPDPEPAATVPIKEEPKDKDAEYAEAAKIVQQTIQEEQKRRQQEATTAAAAAAATAAATEKATKEKADAEEEAAEQLRKEKHKQEIEELDREIKEQEARTERNRADLAMREERWARMRKAADEQETIDKKTREINEQLEHERQRMAHQDKVIEQVEKLDKEIPPIDAGIQKIDDEIAELDKELATIGKAEDAAFADWEKRLNAKEEEIRQLTEKLASMPEDEGEKEKEEQETQQAIEQRLAQAREDRRKREEVARRLPDPLIVEDHPPPGGDPLSEDDMDERMPYQPDAEDELRELGTSPRVTKEDIEKMERRRERAQRRRAEREDDAARIAKERELEEREAKLAVRLQRLQERMERQIAKDKQNRQKQVETFRSQK